MTSTTVADSVRSMAENHETPVVNARPKPEISIWQRVWPREFDAYRDNPNAVPLVSDTYYPNQCPNCGGNGVMMVYVISEGPYQFPKGKCKWMEHNGKKGWWVGELKLEYCPVCRSGHKRAYLEQNCGLSGSDLNISLETFSIKGAFADKAPALAAARLLLGMNTQPAGFLTFVSEEYGVGKTHLLKGLVNGFRQIEVMGRYITLPDLLQEIKDFFGEDGNQSEQVIQNYRKANVLCLDELDKVHLTGWSRETIFRLLNSRYEERDTLLTVMASNTHPENMPSELGYLASRMREGEIIPVAGPDVRVAKSSPRERKDLE